MIRAVSLAVNIENVESGYPGRDHLRADIATHTRGERTGALTDPVK
jgi:hypothetical protein